MRISRRHFLRGSLAAAALLGCGGGSASDPDADAVTPGPDDGNGDGGGDPDASVESCDDPLAGGELLGTVALRDDGSPTFAQLQGDGLDARMMTDLSQVSRQSPLIATEKFYVRTATPDALPPADGWTVRLDGLVEQPVDIPIADIVAAATDRGVHVMECAGNGSGEAMGLMSAGRWKGVPIGKILDRARPAAGAARYLFNGYDRHDGPSQTSFAGAAWIFSRDQLEGAGAFLATHLGGEPLGELHGRPVRLVMPNWYGCTCIKWLQTITFVADDVAPTFHMLEFAHRVMQQGEPKLARDWAPAVIDQAAMPVRVEKWSVGGKLRYLVTGILWGGDRPTDRLLVRFGGSDDWRAVDVCPSMKSNGPWTIWGHVWDPPATGTYAITCRIDDSSIQQRRLDAGYYARSVKITEV